MPKVRVFSPVYTPAPTTTQDSDSTCFVLYPMIAYRLRLRFRRIGMKDRVMEYFAYVDCIRAGVERGDSILPVEEWEVEEKRLMKGNIGEKEADEIAVNAAKSWGNMMVISWWNPSVEIVEKVGAYKIFWICSDHVLDSLTGEKFAVSR